jgi:solute carrier family 25 2-oxodicarboxylate transporter 21
MSSVQSPKTRIRSRLTPFENLAVGALGGAVETTIQMPILTFKFSKQEGRPLPTTFGGWYRGVFVQAGTVAPITAIQMLLNGMLGSLVLRGEIRNLTDGEKMCTSAGAGALSALVYGPVDLTTIQQQKLGLNPIQTLSAVIKKHGNLSIFRGFCATAIRESIYTAGYLGMGPVVTAGLVTHFDIFSKASFSHLYIFFRW